MAKKVGVDTHVLRYWESEFNMKPHRSDSGQRLYREQDLEAFHRIRSLLQDAGYTIAGARKALRRKETGDTDHTDALRNLQRAVGALRERIDAARRDIVDSD